MGSVEEKLRRGFDLVERAGRDGDLLGMALIAFHSALADYLDDALLRQPDLGADYRQMIADKGLGWRERADLAQRAGLITSEQRQRILDVNRQRAAVAHGDRFSGSARSVEGYGEMVAALAGVDELRRAGHTATTTRQTAARPAAGARGERQTMPRGEAPQAEASSWAQRTATRRSRQTEVLPENGTQRLLMAGGALLLLLVVAWLALGQLLPQPEERGEAIAQQPQAPIVLPTPAAPTATPAPKLATVVNLGGAAGWLRTTPSFRAPTQPIPLSEGMEVTVLDDAPVDAEGTRWRKVSVPGYEGWCPEHNLKFAGT